MSILFVLLTFLLILTVMYFRRPQEDANTLQVAPAKKMSPPLMVKQAVMRAWITRPGEASFCTTTPAIGERTASCGLIATP